MKLPESTKGPGSHFRARGQVLWEAISTSSSLLLLPVKLYTVSPTIVANQPVYSLLFIKVFWYFRYCKIVSLHVDGLPIQIIYKIVERCNYCVCNGICKLNKSGMATNTRTMEIRKPRNISFPSPPLVEMCWSIRCSDAPKPAGTSSSQTLFH